MTDARADFAALTREAVPRGTLWVVDHRSAYYEALRQAYRRLWKIMR